eukprot:724745-Hanusia_phi.AAC.1
MGAGTGGAVSNDRSRGGSHGRGVGEAERGEEGGRGNRGSEGRRRRERERVGGGFGRERKDVRKGESLVASVSSVSQPAGSKSRFSSHAE